MLNNKKLQRLRTKQANHDGHECPECGDRKGIEWNGARGTECGYACNGHNGCGTQWNARDYDLTDDEHEYLSQY